tara:strand:- start:1880 stop:2785 length:906 start_codon:yes stop_codon:yes gene_type:complete
MPGTPIPSFYLYGEAPRAVDDSFLHLERLDDRSRPSEWTIRAHSHSDLHQIFLIEMGGGDVHIEGEKTFVKGPVLITVPATAVHGFDWTEETSGWVLTIAAAFYEHLVHEHADLTSLFERSLLLPLDRSSQGLAAAWASDLLMELGWSATGHRAAAEASVLRIAVLCARLAEEARGKKVGIAASPAAALVARFRALVEERFRSRQPVTAYASALGSSTSSLRNACQTIAGRSPSQILDDRAALEAKRMLLYSNLSISEICFALGFAEPAYFSRFFSKQTGMSPSEYRAQRSQPSAAAPAQI